MIVAHIDKDYIWNPGDPIIVGTEWTEKEAANYLFEPWLHNNEECDELEKTLIEGGDDLKVRFRMSDDDGEVYYGGWLLNDGGCIVQSMLLKWAERHAGCTTIEVKDSTTTSGGWKMEIG